MPRIKDPNLKGIYLYVFLDDYNFLKDYCKKYGQRGDYTHLIKESIRKTVKELKKIDDKCKKEVF